VGVHAGVGRRGPAGFVQQVTSSPAWDQNSLLFITFDEGATTDTAGCGPCHDTSAGGRIGAFSESLRQEYTKRHVRVSLVEPGGVRTELTTHMRDEIQEGTAKRFADVELLEAEDIADAIAYIVTRHRRIAVNEILIRPTEQDF
jgi:NAD(P)-dependent dehydrogenase (short-subunit alcohol dehydrogenase family)